MKIYLRAIVLCLMVLTASSPFALDNAPVPPRPQPTLPPNSNLPNLPINPNVDVSLQLDQSHFNRNNSQAVQETCGNRCCVYQDRFYSEGSIVSVADGILLMCKNDPNTFGAGSLRWERLFQ